MIAQPDTSLINIELLIDSSVKQDGEFNFVNELEDAILKNEIVPMKYLYCTTYAYERWVKFCQHKNYSFYHNSIKLIKRIASELPGYILKGTKGLNFISLGTGNGIKDEIIIQAIVSKVKPNAGLYYHSIEISPQLLIESLKHLASKLSFQQLKIKAILGDFNLIEKYREVYEKSIPNVFLLLGNTFGNSDESSLIDGINKSMKKEDYLLIEINTSKTLTYEELNSDEVFKMHDFSPLAVLGIKYNPSKLKYILSSANSKIAKTKSVTAIYKSAIIKKQKKDNIKLSVMHHYNKSAVISFFEKEAGLKTLKIWSQNSITLFLFKRK